MVALGYVIKLQVGVRLFCSVTVEEKRNLHFSLAWKCCFSLAEHRECPGVDAAHVECVYTDSWHCPADSLVLGEREIPPFHAAPSARWGLTGQVFVAHLRHLGPVGLKRGLYLSVHFLQTPGLCSLLLQLLQLLGVWIFHENDDESRVTT